MNTVKTRPVARKKPVKKFGRKPSSKHLVRELRGGEPYEYFPLGKYIVAAPGVCGGRPTFKYTRIDVKHVLDALAGGWTIDQVVYHFRASHISEAAVREAIHLATQSFEQNSSVPVLAA